MDYQFMPMQVRRKILERSMSIASNPFGADHPEAKLLESFQTVRDLERRKIRLLESGPSDCFWEIHLARVATTQAMHVEDMCAVRATTMQGLRARAQAYAFWDAGELPHRARLGGTTDDLMLDAIVRDLTMGAIGDARPRGAGRLRRA